MLTKRRWSDPVARAVISLIGSVVVVLSGIMLISDKILPDDFTLDNTHGFKDTQTYIWVLTQTLSPIFLLIAAQLRAYRVSYIVPFYMYFIQIYWIYDPGLRWDDWLLHIYAAGATILATLVAALLHYYLYKSRIARNDRMTLLENLVEAAFKIKRDNDTD